LPDWTNPIGKGAKPARIDMGVDYTGSFPLYAMGSGTITNISNSGWPGGKFIGLHLDSGQYMYYAENINPNVIKGQRVTKGQLIGTAINQYPFVEIGWAAPPGTGETMAAATGQANKTGDPGEFSTGYGVDMSNLIKSLGGPAGIQTPGGVRGSVPAGYDPGSSGTSANLTSATGSLLQGCVPLVGWVYLAVRYTSQFQRNLSRNKSLRRKGPHEERQQSRRQSTSETSSRRRRWHRKRQETSETES
jgi:Peptidase family M23